MKKSIFSLSLIIALLLWLPIPVFSSTEVQPRYTYIDTTSGSLEIDTSNGQATISAKITAKQIVPVKVECSLQQYKNGIWSELKAWETNGSFVAKVNATYYVVSGYSYRICVTGYVYDSQNTLLESDSFSDSVYYPKK